MLLEKIISADLTETFKMVMQYLIMVDIFSILLFKLEINS